MLAPYVGAYCRSMSTVATTHVPVGGPTLPQERRLVTSIPGPRSKEILDRKAEAVAPGIAHSVPIATVAAGGGVVVDADGNSLIDLGSGIAVTTIGNAHPKVVAAVQEQVAQFTHTCFMVSPYEGYVQVAETLNRITPGDFAKKTALFNAGAEAVENGVKIARKYTGRQAVVVFENAYHGRTNLTMAMTAKNMPYKSGFGPFAPDIYRAPMSYPFHDGLSGADAAARAITMIEKEVGADNVAALVIEPIQGEGGFIVPADGFLPALVDWCHKSGAVFIADEVQAGLARAGAMFASELFGIVPDMVLTAKGIAGGLPLSGVTGRAEIMDAAHPGGLGGTYGGNPVVCAAAIAALDVLENDGMIERAREIETILLGRLHAMAEADPRVGDVRGRGAMIAAEFVDPVTGAPDAALTKAVAADCISQGVVVLTCGMAGNVIRFLPPLTISDALLNEGLDVVASALAAH